MADGVVKNWPRTLLRLEGACIFGCATWAYNRTGQGWWGFAAGLLLPDLAMAGYAANNSVGAASYNLVHTETPPLLLLSAGIAMADSFVSGVGLIWLAHIGMDRMLGYGLKYGSFGHTHLGIMGGGITSKEQ